jgi:hypothetical protein
LGVPRISRNRPSASSGHLGDFRPRALPRFAAQAEPLVSGRGDGRILGPAAVFRWPFALGFRPMKDLSLEEKIGIGFWVGVVLFMLSQILLVVFAIAFFLGHFVWPQ